jgi:hypothetical protein
VIVNASASVRDALTAAVIAASSVAAVTAIESANANGTARRPHLHQLRRRQRHHRKMNRRDRAAGVAAPVAATTKRSRAHVRLHPVGLTNPVAAAAAVIGMDTRNAVEAAVATGIATENATEAIGATATGNAATVAVVRKRAAAAAAVPPNVAARARANDLRRPGAAAGAAVAAASIATDPAARRRTKTLRRAPREAVAGDGGLEERRLRFSFFFWLSCHRSRLSGSLIVLTHFWPPQPRISAACARIHTPGQKSLPLRILDRCSNTTCKWKTATVPAEYLTSDMSHTLELRRI